MFKKIKNKIKNLIKNNLNYDKDISIINEITFSQREMLIELAKNKNEKIKIVFLCYRPAVWGSLKSVYEACLQNELIEPIIIAVPNKKDLPEIRFNHEEYVDEGAYDYFINLGYQNVIKGYDFETKKWINLAKLKPNYVFIQTPYDVCRPLRLSSKVISSYAKTCFVHYATPFMNGNIERESSPVNFIENIDFIFAVNNEQSELFKDILLNKSSLIENKVIISSAPKFDVTDADKDDATSEWQYKGESKKIRVLWTPRWCLDENNCTFFEMKDQIVEFFKKNDEFELLFRPHPQAFNEYLRQGIMNSDEINNYKKLFNDIDNIQIDSFKDYINNFYTSDILISDESSVITEYYLTEKPIIFTYKETHFTEFAKEMSKGFYWAKTWDEVQKYLIDLKKEDKLINVRKQVIKDCFSIPNEGSGNYILSYLVNDFLGENHEK